MSLPVSRRRELSPARPPLLNIIKHTQQDLFPLYSDVDDIRRVQVAHEFVTDQLRSK